MTTEEAIKYAEDKRDKLQAKMNRPGGMYGDHAIYSAELEFVSEAISALRAQQQPNAPLTLDELRGMDREPVYIWYPYPKYGEWVISDGFNQYKNFTSTDNDSWYSGDYGKTWIAYRHKPGEGTR